MIRIKIGNKDGFANRMFRHMYCRNLQAMLPNSELSCVDIPEFNLRPANFELEGRILHVKTGQRHSMTALAYQLSEGIYDSLQFDGYGQRLEYYPNRDVCSAHFRSSIIVDRTHLGPGNLTIHVRGDEVLRQAHIDYNPVPVSFYEQIANATGLNPVIMGQLGDNAYSDEIRKRFSGCIFLPSKPWIEDFEIIRNSTNIAIGVSTFGWLAAWFSKTAQTIHLPVSGIFNPKQRLDIDLLPTRDARYSFYEFPVFSWQATEEQHRALLVPNASFRTITSAEARALIGVHEPAYNR